MARGSKVPTKRRDGWNDTEVSRPPDPDQDQDQEGRSEPGARGTAELQAARSPAAFTTANCILQF
jgi:hypothetical protein